MSGPIAAVLMDVESADMAGFDRQGDDDATDAQLVMWCSSPARTPPARGGQPGIKAGPAERAASLLGSGLPNIQAEPTVERLPLLAHDRRGGAQSWTQRGHPWRPHAARGLNTGQSRRQAR